MSELNCEGTYFVFGEGGDHSPLCVDALVDLERPAAWHDRCVSSGQSVRGRPVATSQLEYITKSARGYQGASVALPLENGICSDRRPMNYRRQFLKWGVELA